VTRLVISGYYGFGNAGDEAMLLSMVRSLRAIEPGIELTVLSADPAKTRANHPVSAIGRFDLPAIALALGRVDALVSGAGSLLQDVTSRRNVYYYLGVMGLALAMGRPLVVYANGIGPVQARIARRLTAGILARARLITVRDEQSLEELQTMGIRGVLSADPALALEPPGPERGLAILRDLGVGTDGPLVLVAPRHFPGSGRAFAALAGAADYLVRTCRARVLFVPMQFPEDGHAAAAIQERMREPAFELRRTLPPGDLLSLTGHARILLGVRLHALIFAAIMGVPALGIAYDPKIPGFMASIGLPSLAPGDLRAEDVLIEVDRLLREGTAIRCQLAARVETLRAQAEASARLTLDCVGRPT
jgi:polysaccharide pyruvyl transferase CsaB